MLTLIIIRSIAKLYSRAIEKRFHNKDDWAQWLFVATHRLMPDGRIELRTYVILSWNKEEYIMLSCCMFNKMSWNFDFTAYFDRNMLRIIWLLLSPWRWARKKNVQISDCSWAWWRNVRSKIYFCNLRNENVLIVINLALIFLAFFFLKINIKSHVG